MFLGVSDSPTMCAWASIKPGINVRPPTSTTIASPRSIGVAETVAMRPSFTRTENERCRIAKPSRTRFALMKSVCAIRSPSCVRGSTLADVRRPRLELLGEFRIASTPHLFVVGPGDDGHLVDADTLLQLDDAYHDLGPRAGEGVAAELGDPFLIVRFKFLRRFLGRDQRAHKPAVAVDAREHARRELVLRLFHGRRRQRPHAEARVRRRMTRARAVGALVEIDGALAAGAVAEEPGIAVGQAEQGGDLRAIVGA